MEITTTGRLSCHKETVSCLCCLTLYSPRSPSPFNNGFFAVAMKGATTIQANFKKIQKEIDTGKEVVKVDVMVPEQNKTNNLYQTSNVS